MRYRINLPCLPSETAQCKAVTLELSYIRIWKQLSQVIPWSLPFPANNAQCSFPSTTSATCWLTRSFPQSTCVSTSSTSWGYPITCSLHGCPPPKLLTWCRGLYPYPAPLAPTYYPYGNLKHLSTFGQITSLLCFKFFNDCWLYSEWNQFCNMASKVLYDLTPPPHSSKCIPPSLSSLSATVSFLLLLQPSSPACSSLKAFPLVPAAWRSFPASPIQNHLPERVVRSLTTTRSWSTLHPPHACLSISVASFIFCLPNDSFYLTLCPLPRFRLHEDFSDFVYSILWISSTWSRA